MINEGATLINHIFRTLLLFTLITLLPTQNAAAVSGSMDRLGLPLPARHGGMGGAGLTLSEGAAAHFANPAALTNMRQARNELLFGHLFLREDRSFSLVSYARQTENSGFIACSLSSFLVQGIEKRNALGEKEGTFNNIEMVVSFAHARALSYSLRSGITVSHLHQKLGANQANGYAVDMGLTYRPFLTHDLLLGANLKNAIANLYWDTGAKDRPSFTPGLGLSYSPLGWPVSAAIDCVINHRWQDMPLRVGVESWAYEEHLGLRLGWNDQLLACGLSFKENNRYRLDYCFNYHSSYLDDGHALDLSFFF